MALVPETQFAGKIAPSDAEYPFGKARDVTTSGDGLGTPLRQSWLNDMWGFYQKLLSEAGVTPSGDPDTVLASQYFEALMLTAGSPTENAIVDGAYRFWYEGTTAASSTASTAYKTSTMSATEHSDAPSDVVQRRVETGDSDVIRQDAPTVEFAKEVDVPAGLDAAAGFVRELLPIENVRRYAGQTVTVSLYLDSTTSGDVAVGFVQNFGVGGSADVEVAGVLVSTTTAQTRFDVQIDVPSVSGKTIGDASYLGLRLWFAAGSDYSAQAPALGVPGAGATFRFTGVQVKEGAQVTRFEEKTPSQARSSLTPYYQQNGVKFDRATYAGFRAFAANFPAMRAVPSVTATGLAGSNKISLVTDMSASLYNNGVDLVSQYDSGVSATLDARLGG